MKLFEVFGDVALKGQQAVEQGLTGIDKRGKALGSRLDSLGKGIGNTGGAMSRWVSGPIAAVTVGLGVLTNKASDTARELRVMSRVSNTNTEQFQRNAFAARSVGIENEKLADIYKDVTDRIGDFTTAEAGPMVDFFEKVAPKVGVTADQFKNLSGPDALQLFVSTMEKAGLSQQEMTFHMEAMAGDATRLLPLLQNNGKAMKQLGDEAAAAGLILSEGTIESLNGSANEMEKLKLMAEVTAVRLGAVLVPALTELIPIIQSAVIPAINKAVEVLAQIAQGFAALPEPMQQMIVAGTGIVAALGPVLLVVGKLVSIIGTAIGAVSGIAGVLGGMSAALGTAAAAAGPLLAALAPFVGVIAAIAAAVAGAVLIFKNWNAIMNAVAGAADWLASAISSGFSDAWSVVQQFGQAITGFFQSLPGMVVQYVTQMASGVVNKIKGMVSGAINALKDMYNKVVGNSIIPDMVTDVGREMTRMTDEGTAAAQGMSSGVSDSLENTQSGFGAQSQAVTAGSAGGLNVDMRHAIIRDDRDMTDRLRRAGSEQSGAF